jgi:hypothetical protein
MHATLIELEKIRPFESMLEEDCILVSTDLRLEQKLGSWIGTRHLDARCWPTYLSSDGQRLFHYDNDCLRCSSRETSRTRHTHKFPRQSVVVPSLPHDVIPVAVQRSPTTSIVRSVPFPMVTPDPNTPPAPPAPKNFFEMVNTLPYWQSSLLVHLDSEHQPARLKQLIEGGEPLKLFLVSDGGAKGDLGSF